MVDESTLRIGVDVRCLNRDRIRGMGKYVSEVMSRIDRSERVQWRLFADEPESPLHVPKLKHVKTDVFAIRGYRIRSWEQFALPWRARRARVDVLHSTMTTLPWLQPIPTVVTLHDTIPWDKEDSSYQGGWYLNHVVPRALHKCASVITISNSSRRDILRLWPKLENKLVVIPHGVDDLYLNIKPGPLGENLRKFGIREPYFLYVGGGRPRKRFDWAVKILEKLADPRIQLVTCGIPEALRIQMGSELKPETQSRICFAPFIQESEMPRLFQNAIAVLYPTLYEGFGFPALDAQAVGTPVLFSDVGSLSELKGPGAEVLPTENLEAWVQVCRRLTSERLEESHPNESARQWAARFSWDICAARHFDVYQDAAEKSKRRFGRARKSKTRS